MRLDNICSLLRSVHTRVNRFAVVQTRFIELETGTTSHVYKRYHAAQSGKAQFDFTPQVLATLY